MRLNPLCYLTSRISSVILWILNYQFLFKLAALLATSYNSLLWSRSGLGSRQHLITPLQPATFRSSLNPTTGYQLQNCLYAYHQFSFTKPCINCRLQIFYCTGCSKTSCKFFRLVTQSFFGLFSVFWAFLYHKLWAIFHSSTSGTWNWKKRFKNLILKKG